MYTGNFDYDKVNAIKIILENQEGKILLIQEPADNEWMPLHWGLPGGKPTKNESISETLKRKVEKDIGIDVEIEGIVEIEEILMENRTVLMYIIKAKTTLNEVKGQINSFKWVSKEDIDKMDISEFTEYYNKRLLSDNFENKLHEPISLSVIKTGEYFKMIDEPNYIKWIESGNKK